MAAPSVLYQPAPMMPVIYDTDTLSLRVWDGALEAGSIVIGAVTQSGIWTLTPSGTQAVSSTTLATQATLASALTELQSILTKLNASLAVTGSFYQATQPISAASLPTHGVTGPLTDAELRAVGVPITYAALLTELQLKADLSETQPVSGPLTDAQLRAATVPISGTVTTAAPTSATTAFTSPSALITSTTVLASNANRRGATIYNESGAICFIKLGATASLTSYTVQIPIGGSYEVPFGYTGVIDGITVAITAVLRVTEFTA